MSEVINMLDYVKKQVHVRTKKANENIDKGLVATSRGMKMFALQYAKIARNELEAVQKFYGVLNQFKKLEQSHAFTMNVAVNHHDFNKWMQFRYAFPT